MDSDAALDDLHIRYRPRRVTTLFVGESSPAQGTHFYLANSNLFRATQSAFAVALGADAVPSAEAFLRLFASKGCWLVDLADRPVNRLPTKERRVLVEQGIGRLAEVIAETRPKHIVVIKTDIAAAVERAIELAGVKPPNVLALRYPLRQYRGEYIARLAELLEAQFQRRAAKAA
jgi:hypothetical protein